MCEVASFKNFENSLTTVKVMTITKVAPFYLGHGVKFVYTIHLLPGCFASKHHIETLLYTNIDYNAANIVTVSRQMQLMTRTTEHYVSDETYSLII